MLKLLITTTVLFFVIFLSVIGVTVLANLQNFLGFCAYDCFLFKVLLQFSNFLT